MYCIWAKKGSVDCTYYSTGRDNHRTEYVLHRIWTETYGFEFFANF